MWMTVEIVSPSFPRESTSPSGHIGNLRNDLILIGIQLPCLPSQKPVCNLQAIGFLYRFGQGCGEPV